MWPTVFLLPSHRGGLWVSHGWCSQDLTSREGSITCPTMGHVRPCRAPEGNIPEVGVRGIEARASNWGFAGKRRPCTVNSLGLASWNNSGKLWDQGAVLCPVPGPGVIWGRGMLACCVRLRYGGVWGVDSAQVGLHKKCVPGSPLQSLRFSWPWEGLPLPCLGG